jgi:hypothetical protein
VWRAGEKARGGELHTIVACFPLFFMEYSQLIGDSRQYSVCLPRRRVWVCGPTSTVVLFFLGYYNCLVALLSHHSERTGGMSGLEHGTAVSARWQCPVAENPEAIAGGSARQKQLDPAHIIQRVTRPLSPSGVDELSSDILFRIEKYAKKHCDGRTTRMK